MIQIGELTERISRISVSTTMRVASEAERLRRAGVDVVDFGAGEPDFPTPGNIKQAGIRAIEENFTKYTAAGGTLDLREAVCDRHAADFGTSYQPSECAITVGGKHAIFNAVQVLVNPGDDVVIPAPYWVTYKDVVDFTGGRCIFVETDEREGFRLTASMIEASLTPQTRMVIVNSPNNPSGKLLDEEEFARLLDITSRRGVWILTDECYCRFLYKDKPFSVASLPGARNTVIVAGSLSKTYAMTGWRIGFALAPQRIIDAIVRLQSHSTSNPTSVAQRAAIEALRGPQDSVDRMLAEYRRRRDFVIARLRKISGLTCAEPDGAFYAFPNIASVLSERGVRTALEFTERLLEQEHVAVVPGEAFGVDRHFRISFATSMCELERGLDRIERFVISLPR